MAKKLNILSAPVAARSARAVREIDPLDGGSWPRFVDDGDLDMLVDRFSKAASNDSERSVYHAVLRRAYDDAAELEILFGEVPGVLAGDPQAQEHFRETLEDAAARGVGIAPDGTGTAGATAMPFTPRPDPPQVPCHPRFLIQPFVVSAIVEAADRISSGDRTAFSRYVRIIGGLWRQTDNLERLYRQALEGVSRTGRDRLIDTLRLVHRDFVRPGAPTPASPAGSGRLDPAVTRLAAVDDPHADLAARRGRPRLPSPGDEPISIIWPPGPGGVGLPRDPCDLLRDACRTMVLGGASRLTIPLPSSTYADGIEAIVPPAACAGSTIHIIGHGFGSVRPADVTILLGGSAARVISWSDRDIAVVVPAGAASGCVGFRSEQAEVRRRALHEQNERARAEIGEGLACLRRGAIWPRIKYTPSTVPCTGANYFGGTAPEIDFFRVNSQTAATVRPGTSLLLTWSVRNASTIAIRRTSGDGPAANASNPPGQMLNLGPITGTRAVTATYELTATNGCGTASAKVSVMLRAALRITSIEATQSIQTADSLLPLVKGKPTVVRVYLQSRDGNWDGVTGRLTVRGAGGPLSPLNGPEVRASSAGSDRRTLDDSLVFQLPEGATEAGERWLEAEIFAASGETAAASSALRVSFSDVTMEAHVYGVRMGYRNVSASAQADFGLTSSDWPAKPFSAFEPQRQLAESLFPVTKLEVRKLPGDPQPEIVDWNNATGYLDGRAWGQRLIDMAFPRGGERIYVLQPEEQRGAYHGNTNPPDGVGNIVMNGWDTPDDVGATFAHELGHSWELWHVGYVPGTMRPLASSDASFPYPDGWMGPDVGVRVTPRLQLFPGDAADGTHTTHDIMSYTHPQWISPYHYCKLMREFSGGALACPAGQQTFSLRAGPSPSVVRPGFTSTLRSRAVSPGIRTIRGGRVRRFLYVLGRLHDSGRASLDPFEIVPSSDDIETRMKGSAYQLVLEDGSGNALRVISFDRSPPESEPRDSTTLFSMFVAYDTPAARIVLRRSGEVLAERRASKSAPVVELAAMPGRKPIGGKVTIRWSARDPDGARLVFSLWYSPDSGQTFLPVNASMGGASAVVDFDHVPPSARAVLRVLASNGVTTTEARSAPFAVRHSRA